MRMINSGVALALLLGVSGAHAAGLGKLTVNSALGQPLNAEIDLVSVQPGELDQLIARVAPPEAFRDARIEYSSSLRLLRFSVEKRASGQPYLKVTSIGPVNEPFVDALIEVSWPQGRIQREYPILLDPPGYNQRAAPPTTSAATASRAPETSPATAPASSSAPSAAATTSAPSASSAAAGTGTPSAASELPRPSTALATEPSGASGDTYGPVQKGDTLRKIAEEVKPSSVSLEQMLVALYRENKTAFVGNNMNRLKAGQILKVPSADEVNAVERKEANTEIRTHVADWKAYREQVAGSVGSVPARPETSSGASGRVTSAAVTPPPAPVTDSNKDVLKLSKSDTGKGTAAAGKAGDQARIAALQEDLTAKDKALAEAKSRVSDLEKQIRDMQRLLDLKSAAPAGKAPDTKLATTSPPPAPAKTPEPAKPEPAKPEPVKPADTKAATAPPPTPAKPEPAKVEPVKPADTKLAEAPKADAPKVAEAPKPAPPKTDAKAPAKKPPPPPPEKSFVDELTDNPVYLLGGLGLLALGGGAFLFMRRRRNRVYEPPASAMGSAFPSDLKVDTTTGKPGGGLVDTGNSSFLTDFDKTGPGTIDTDEVDPVAEAEVYIAYGRDAQAEEILKEAMARDRSRPEISLKLLEIYHARKSATAFETVAKELHSQVGESHPLWQKAAAMGAQIDPNNPLYGGVSPAAAAAVFAAAPAAAPRPDFDIASTSSSGAGQSTDFDLDAKPGEEAAAPALDFDIAHGSAAASETHEAKADEKPAGFDFDLSGLDFPSGGSKPADLGAGAAPPSVDLADLSLDTPGDSGGEGMNTQLELAKAYLEIGDKDGAREILQEVAKGGTAAQKDEAQRLISSL